MPNKDVAILKVPYTEPDISMSFSMAIMKKLRQVDRYFCL